MLAAWARSAPIDSWASRTASRPIICPTMRTAFRVANRAEERKLLLTCEEGRDERGVSESDQLFADELLDRRRTGGEHFAGSGFVPHLGLHDLRARETPFDHDPTSACGILEHDSHERLTTGPARKDIAVRDAAWPIKAPFDRLEQGGLAGAIRADHRDDPLALRFELMLAGELLVIADSQAGEDHRSSSASATVTCSMASPKRGQTFGAESSREFRRVAPEFDLFLHELVEERRNFEMLGIDAGRLAECLQPIRSA